MDVKCPDFQSICRICISTDNILQIQNVKLQEQVDLLNVITDFIKLEDLLNVKLPQNICSSCINFLNSYHNFKLKCNQNEILFKKLLENECKKYSEYIQEQGHKDLSSDDNFDDGDDDVSLLSRREKIKSKIKESKTQNSTEGLLKDGKNYICKYCNKSFIFKYKLRMHIRVHTKEKPFKCDVCNLSFSLNGNLQRHKMIHSGEKPHVCDTCGKGFIQATSLQIHLKKHSREDVKQKYTCKICSRIFVRFIPYRLHLKKLHPNEVQDISEIKPEKNESKTQFECDICSRKFSKLIFLKRHKPRHGEKKFLCTDCGKGFVRKADLQSHFKIHTGEKPHICLVCNKSFAHNGSLVTHSLVHSGYKPYSCSICFKSFTQISHLKVHERTHSGEKPYSCSFCEKTFALKSNLTVHIRIHTGETPYTCNICEKGFYDSSSMKKHKQSHFNLIENNVKSKSIGNV